jgi:hypothetical protein
MARALRGHRAALQLPRQADREVADVDHLLDLTERFGRDLPGLDRDQLSDLGLVLVQERAEALDERPANGRGHRAPARERGPGRRDRRIHLRPAGGGDV